MSTIEKVTPKQSWTYYNAETGSRKPTFRRRITPMLVYGLIIGVIVYIAWPSNGHVSALGTFTVPPNPYAAIQITGGDVAGTDTAVPVLPPITYKNPAQAVHANRVPPTTRAPAPSEITPTARQPAQAIAQTLTTTPPGTAAAPAAVVTTSVPVAISSVSPPAVSSTSAASQPVPTTTQALPSTTQSAPTAAQPAPTTVALVAATQQSAPTTTGSSLAPAAQPAQNSAVLLTPLSSTTAAPTSAVAAK